MLDMVVPVAIIAIIVLAALGGAAVGYRLSRASRSKRRGGLVGVIVALVSPILHGLAPIVWAGLAGSLAAYLAGRLAVRRGDGGDRRDAVHG